VVGWVGGRFSRKSELGHTFRQNFTPIYKRHSHVSFGMMSMTTSDFFGRLFQGIGRIVRRAAPVLRSIARAVASFLGRRRA